MVNVLVLYAHPGQRHSRVNVELARVARLTHGIEFVDLYANYPRFNIDVEVEQKRLLSHSVIILQFPVYWYSTPSLLKEWQDLVLEYGFAYGPGGDKLAGKLLLPVATAGGAMDAYRLDGRNNFPLRTLLSPLEQMANLCGMLYIPPFVLFAALEARADGRVQIHARQYQALLEALRDECLNIPAARQCGLLNVEELPIN